MAEAREAAAIGQSRELRKKFHHRVTSKILRRTAPAKTSVYKTPQQWSSVPRSDERISVSGKTTLSVCQREWECSRLDVT
jgi:hypothetical protein